MKRNAVIAALAAFLVFVCAVTALADCPPHTFGHWEITMAPTCTHVGQKRAICWECGLPYGALESIPALGHLPGEWITLQEPDCVHDRRDGQRCARCGTLINFYTYPNSKHTAGDWEVIVEPTRYANGMKIKACIRCHEMMAVGVIPKLTGDVVGSVACSEGPRFKDKRPGLTDKWYMYTPLDLSAEGKRTFPLIATNHYIIGSVDVTVAGGSVRVEYTLNSSKVTVENEMMTFFPDLASVKTLDPLALEAQNFPFDTAVSIGDNLAGDTSVLMYICLSVDYNYFTAGIKPYEGGNIKDESGEVNAVPPQMDAAELSKYHTLKTGDIDPDVAKLKLRLYDLGYYNRRNDNNLYTAATAEVVMAFQQANRLAADGVATPETQAVLYSEQAVRGN
jgi:hypothetical protein